MQGLITNQRQARVWNHLNAGDWFYRIRQWPGWLQELMLKEHRDGRERFTLFFFLTGNGCPPDIAGQWTLLNDFRGGKEVYAQGYDQSARAQVIQMKRDLQNGKLFKGDKKIMDMHLGRVIKK
jgi:hypothetical protein